MALMAVRRPAVCGRSAGGGLDVAAVGRDDARGLVEFFRHALEGRPVALPGVVEALRAGAGPGGADLGRLAVEVGHRGANLVRLLAELRGHALHLRGVAAEQAVTHPVTPSSTKGPPSP